MIAELSPQEAGELLMKEWMESGAPLGARAMDQFDAGRLAN
jgi:hypothetical protein